MQNDKSWNCFKMYSAGFQRGAANVFVEVYEARESPDSLQQCTSVTATAPQGHTQVCNCKTNAIFI